MKLLQQLAPIAAAMGAGYFLGGGTLSGAVSSEAVKGLATSFLTTTGFGKGESREQPFKYASFERPRSVKQITRGSPSAVPASLQPIERLISGSPRLETAMANLYNNASNQQVREMFSQYSQDASPTLRQGRRTLTIEQPGNIRVDV